jgi:hypothetical protein
MPRTAAVASCAACLAALLAGCGLGAGPAPTKVHLDITREFGAHVMSSPHIPRVRGAETVMSLLLRNARVRTIDSGGFVEQIDGGSGGHDAAGQPVDWFYYVNGVQASKGAADTDVHPGDHIWWDLHDWSQTEEVPAVVGSFPEPFINGIEGLRLPVRVECAQPEREACHTVTARLRAAGVTSAVAELGPAGEEPDTLRVLVGTWSQVHTDLGAERLQRGPRASGVYARPAANGRTLALLNAQGATVQTLSGDAGMIAATSATSYTGEDPEWLVTGTDAAGVERAARDLDEADLRNRFAIAIPADGAVLALPRPGP